LVAAASVTTVALLMLAACDAPPPNPLAAGGISGQQYQPRSGAGGTGGGSSAGFDAGRPTPAPLVSAAGTAALTIETTPTRAGTAPDCPGGPCLAPNVCVNLDFLFVACVPCGGDDQICCPRVGDECHAGLVCAANPNFKPVPPLDLVRDVCQRPGAPPPADGGLNHQRIRLGP
jgi:hypothetical protein